MKRRTTVNHHSSYTTHNIVEPPLKDPHAKGRCIKYFSTGDRTLVEA